MSPAKQVALDRAVAMLSAAGVQYAVRLEDGTVLGQLEVKPPRKGGGPKTDRKVKYHWDRDLGYVAQVRAMKPGDVLTWTVAEGGENLRSAAGATGFRAFGPASCICTCTKVDAGFQVELLRVH
jgi:hypothetical protein